METNTKRALDTQPISTLIMFMQRAILLLRAAEDNMTRNGLKHWYSSRDLERALQGVAGNKSELVELVDLVYRDPYVQMLQAQERAMNGMAMNGMGAMNGMAMNGMAMNGMAMNGMAMNGMAMENQRAFNNGSRSASPVEISERSTPISFLNGYSPKSNISRYNSLLKGGKRRTRRSRSKRR